MVWYTLFISNQYQFAVQFERDRFHVGDTVQLVESNEYAKLKNYYLAHHKENGDER
jgi:ribosomal protein S17